MNYDEDDDDDDKVVCAQLRLEAPCLRNDL